MEGYRPNHWVSTHITARTNGNTRFYTVLTASIA